MRGLCVHLSQRRRQARIRQTTQQPWWGVLFRRRTQCFHEQQVHQVSQHHLAPWSVCFGFFAQLPHERRKTRYAAQLYHCRQQRRQQGRIVRVEYEPAAQQPHVGRAVLPAMADFAGL
ncbi:hypothetical protein D3C78_1258000 [compost metagenome]